MNTDMQVLLAKTVFTGCLPTHTFDIPGTPLWRHESPGALIETQLTVPGHILVATAVSATLRKEFKCYLKTQMRKVAETTWDSVIQCGMRICHIESYPVKTSLFPQIWLPDFTVVEWHLRLGVGVMKD
jgi:hypothetical protein